MAQYFLYLGVLKMFSEVDGQDVREYEGQFMAQLNCFQQVFPVYLWLRYVIPFAQSKEDKQNYRNIKQK